MVRAQMTANTIAPGFGRMRPYLVPGFHERDLGAITGRTPKEVKGLFQEKDLVRTPHTTYAFSRRHGMEDVHGITHRAALAIPIGYTEGVVLHRGRVEKVDTLQ